MRSERDKERDRRNDIRYLEGTTREKKTVHASLSEEERCICGTRKDRGTRTVLRATSGGTKERERELALEKDSDNPCAERRRMERVEDQLMERGSRIYYRTRKSVAARRIGCNTVRQIVRQRLKVRMEHTKRTEHKDREY